MSNIGRQAAIVVVPGSYMGVCVTCYVLSTIENRIEIQTLILKTLFHGQMIYSFLVLSAVKLRGRSL